MFFVGTGGVGIQELTVKRENEDLYKLLYVFIYRLYHPSHFADRSYTRTGFNKETREVIYTVRMDSIDYTNFCPIHARNPFATRTDVLSKPSNSKPGEDDRPVTVLKDQLCRTGRCFSEWPILSKIHQPKRVPGMVEAVHGQIIDTPMSPERRKHLLSLTQTGSSFTSIPKAKKVLETLFDLPEGIWIFVLIRSAHMFASIAVFAFQTQNPSSQYQCRKCNVH